MFILLSFDVLLISFVTSIAVFKNQFVLFLLTLLLSLNMILLFTHFIYLFVELRINSSIYSLIHFTSGTVNENFLKFLVIELN